MSDEGSGKPAPVPSHENEWFWEACNEERFLIQQCTDCEELRFYPAAICPACHSESWTTVEADGEGHVVSFTVVHYAASEVFEDAAPYVVALIELSEGVTVMGNLPDADPADIEVGSDVEIVWEDRGPQRVYQFELS